jgi:hypothetical protein
MIERERVNVWQSHTHNFFYDVFFSYFIYIRESWRGRLSGTKGDEMDDDDDDEDDDDEEEELLNDEEYEAEEKAAMRAKFGKKFDEVNYDTQSENGEEDEQSFKIEELVGHF